MEKLLKSNKVEPLELTLIRVVKEPKYTEGGLIYKNKNLLICDTLEDRIRDIDGNGKLEGDDEKKIMHETAIPYGRFPIKVTPSPKFKRDMVAILDVPHFTGIRMHWGATAAQSSGCVLVGKRTNKNRLKNTGMTDYLVELLLSYGNVGWITIV
jgi:hypothetical protein